MRWIIAFHVIFMVAWFAGLFYLPRLFVYHLDTSEAAGIARFKVMEYKLYTFIMMPAALLTTVLGLYLFFRQPHYYMQTSWMSVKLLAAVLLWIYHGYCGYLVRQFRGDRSPHSAQFYRWFNEIPTVLLMIIVIMVIVRP